LLLVLELEGVKQDLLITMDNQQVFLTETQALLLMAVLEQTLVTALTQTQGSKEVMVEMAYQVGQEAVETCPLVPL
jgi:hypothetical protein